MTPKAPDEIKGKYQDMLNNEIFLSDPIAWMQDDSEFIVMTAGHPDSRVVDLRQGRAVRSPDRRRAQDDQRAGQGHAVHLGAARPSLQRRP